MFERIKFNCGHTYPWVLAGRNGGCSYCDGEYIDGTKCLGGGKPTPATDLNPQMTVYSKEEVK